MSGLAGFSPDGGDDFSGSSEDFAGVGDEFIPDGPSGAQDDPGSVTGGRGGEASLADSLRQLGVDEGSVQALANRYIPKDAVQKRESEYRGELQELKNQVSFLTQRFMSPQGGQPGGNGQAPQEPEDPIREELRRAFGANIDDPDVQRQFEGLEKVSAAIAAGIERKLGRQVQEVRGGQIVQQIETAWRNEALPQLERVYGKGIREHQDSLYREFLNRINQQQYFEPVSLFRILNPDVADQLAYRELQRKQRERSKQREAAATEGFSTVRANDFAQPSPGGQPESKRVPTWEDNFAAALRSIGHRVP